MTTPITADAKDLIALAGRMGIPVDEAVRQVERLIDVAPGLVAGSERRSRTRTYFGLFARET
jgi:hypothetical protein